MKRTQKYPVGSLLSESDHFLKKELYSLIKEDDEIFEFLQESSLDGLWFWDLENPEEEWMNDKFWTTLGYNPDKMPHKASAWQNIIHKEDLLEVHSNFTKHLEDPSHPYDQIVRYKHKQGHTVWIRCRGKVFRDNLGNPIRMLGAHTDITNLKKKEQDLVLQKKVLKEVIDGTDLGTWQWNIQTGETIFNERWAEIIGYTLDELKPISIDTWIKFSNPEDLEKSNTLLNEHFSGKSKVYECEARMRHKNGDYVWVLDKGKVVSWDEQGNPEWMVGSHQEITRQKKEYYRIKLFIEQAPSALAMFDTNFRYVSASKAWFDFFQISDHNIQGKPHDEVVKIVPKNWKSNYEQCLSGKVLKDVEEKVIAKDDSIQWLSWNFRPWYAEKGKIQGVIVNVNDITKIKRERELQAILDVTQAQNRRLKNFAHIVSHNLKSHTGNFEMLLSMLEEEKPELQENNIIQMLVKASKDLSETIIDLNEVVSINTKLSNHQRPIELREIVNSVLRSLQGLILDTGVTIINEVEDGTTILGMAAYLESIVLNLVSNGIKYRSDKEDAFVKLRSKKMNEFVVLEIEDNGLGIDLKRYGNKIFGLYKTFHPQVENSRGVGLFITKNQIEAMEGKIEVKSKVGVGTVFKVYFRYE